MFKVVGVYQAVEHFDLKETVSSKRRDDLQDYSSYLETL